MFLTKPVIAAISGFAVAGGIEIAAWSDIRVMEQSASVGVFCRRWGVPLIDGGTFRLPRLIGLSRALDLILTGRAVSAEEALAIGFANRVVADGQGLTEALNIARVLSQFPQECLRADRFNAYAAMRMTGTPLLQGLKEEFDYAVPTLQAEGAKAFIFEKKGRGGQFDFNADSANINKKINKEPKAKL
jgi:enoyl-CoA hydratase